ncbi:MAG: hypothetical protein AAFZ58_10395 [Pseudomonadota bacterium]
MMTETTPKTSTYGMLAVVLGFLSFAAVIGHFFVGPLDPPPPLETSLADKAASIRDATVAALKGEDYEAEPTVRARTLDDYLTYSFIGLGLVAILLGVIGFVRREHLRPSVAGVALGGMAIAFQVATTLFFALLIAFLIATVLDQLDFSF